MHELLANHMVRWQQERMWRPEWQHRVALAKRPPRVSRRQRVTARVQRLRARWVRPEEALAGGGSR
jgi:hypothetical protein